MGTIITTRIIQLCAVPIVTLIGSYFYAMPCAKIVGIFGRYGIPSQALPQLYPECVPFIKGTSLNQYGIVHAGTFGQPEQAAAVLDMTFGMSMWLALMLHAIGVEIYVSRL
jgi:hypothetical protein